MIVTYNKATSIFQKARSAKFLSFCYLKFRQRMNPKPYTASPMPEYLKNHIKENNSINFQVIGAVGKGKSTMIKNLIEIQNSEAQDDPITNLPKIGSSETTLKPSPYKYGGVFLWDMPGLGGNVLLFFLALFALHILRTSFGWKFWITMERFFERTWNWTFWKNLPRLQREWRHKRDGVIFLKTFNS